MDNCSAHRSHIFKSFADYYKITLSFSLPYRPTSNGLSENSVQQIKVILKSFIMQFPKTKWSDFLPYVAFSMNSTYHESLGKTPNEVVFGRKLAPPDTAFLQVPENLAVSTGKLSQQEIFAKIWRETNDRLNKVHQDRKERYDSSVNMKNLKPGDLVLREKPVPLRHVGKLFQTNYDGPYNIVSLSSPNCVIKHVNRGDTLKVHILELKKLRHMIPPPPTGSSFQPQVPPADDANLGRYSLRTRQKVNYKV